MTKIISRVGTIGDTDFLKQVFQNVPDDERSCILLLDEVYVKPSLTYQGGYIFGKAVNKPESLATTVSSFMICSLSSKIKFLYKALPVYLLETNFVYEQTLLILDAARVANVNIKAIFCDNNRVNQGFFN